MHGPPAPDRVMTALERSPAPAAGGVCIDCASSVGSTEDTVTLLRHSRLKLTKCYELVDGKRKKAADYPNAKTFTLHRVPVHGLGDLAAVILKAHRDGRTAIIRAEPLFETPWYGRALLHIDPKTGDEASLAAKARRWVCIDVDQLSAPEPTSKAAARYARSRLPEPFRAAEAVAQFSASAGIDADAIKLHLWFWLSEPLATNQLKWVSPSHTSVPVVAFGDGKPGTPGRREGTSRRRG